MSFWTPDAKETGFMASREAKERQPTWVDADAEEFTDIVEVVSKEVDGQYFTGIRFYDSVSTVVLWGKLDMRPVFRRALAMLDAHYSKKPPYKADVEGT
jgi:hypothetical protein